MLIILLLVVFMIGTFFGFMFIKNTIAHWLVGGISFLLLAGSVAMLTMHIKDNWGMKEVTTSSTHQIYTAGDNSAPYGMMIKAEIGKNTDNYVLVYRNSEKAEKAEKADTNFKPNQKNIVEAVKKSATYKLVDDTKAIVTTKTTRRVWSSDFYKLLFSVGGEQNELVKQQSVVSVPKDTWLVLTQDQVKKLSQEAPAMQKQMEAQFKADPQKAAQLAALQKSNPTEYAKMQVKQIKQLLGITE
ncbi:DUF4811 domain-containing protein [Lactococcus cremoris]|uniref:DUF4811 domain-containing protein n=1 Tax=Lactococcus lactis subsp. cremoris TaxID=1359 RepID=A0A1V0PGH3_LACLC|nr:DUF4811 domain-containing protein [Lactococcus cremoris]ARE28316.1 DUF4811 domain-containing protein [Lactococcus cremoris]EUN35387.1 hypothetical protein LLCHP_0236 [Lactococcus cremoris subsp. cremoris HP]KZK09940.1 hypothetical protein AB995_1803 [Lactococcus cremoris]KZK43597.1 hypothetical protein LMG6897_0184 [Lactococcus cremoris]KZK48206.1 hypothetical protein FG2_0996 [Lactococcus cremoris]